jgi:mono/diheme cytochrome c family protein
LTVRRYQISKPVQNTFAIAAFLLAAAPSGLTAFAAKIPVKPTVAATTPPLLATHCAACHNADDANGGFRIDTLPAAIDTAETADRWQKVLGVLNSGEMPPKDEPQLDPVAKTELLDDLANALVAARKVLADTGGVITMRRLNRREYVNTLQELLGVIATPSGLPADDGAGTFDTFGEQLYISADQIEQYHEIATTVIEEAWRRYGSPHPSRTHRMEAEVTTPGVRRRLAERIDERRRYVIWKNTVEAAARMPENQAAIIEIRKNAKPSDFEPIVQGWRNLQGAPSPQDFQFADAVNAFEMGNRDFAMRVPYHTLYASHPAVEKGAFLAVGDAKINIHLQFRMPQGWPPGEYTLRLRVAATDESPPERRFLEYGPWGPDVGAGSAGCHEITGTMTEPQTLEIPVLADGGQLFVFREKGSYDSDAQAQRVFFEFFKKNGIGPPLNIWIDWVEVEGPLPATQQPPAALAALLTVPAVEQPGATKPSAEQDIRGTLEGFCLRAFRGRAPDAGFLDRLVAMYVGERAAGRPFREAVTAPLAVVLSSPHFLYLVEPTQAPQRRQLDGLELASRLSYFLWSGPPDDALLALAKSGEIIKPEVLAAQVDRMIDDPRSRRFVAAFTHQWLGVYRLDFFQFKDNLFPRYDRQVKAASRQEIFETVAFLLEENLSLRNLLKSDFVVVNAVMASYYGLAGVHGDNYRMVKLPKGSPRGGLLGMAAINAMGSNGEQTSPVERGAWVLRKLLDDSPPPAPPNVPQLTRLEGQLLTTRERVRAHQEEPQCASCHRKIDPIGFGLENFDAVGQWRTRDSSTTPDGGTKEWEIDPSGALYGGSTFQDYFELRDLVAARHADFATGFTKALVSYALGRPVGFTDEDLVRGIMAKAASQDDAVREFVHAVVQSDAFRMK